MVSLTHMHSSASDNFQRNLDSLSRWLHSGSSNMAVIEVPMISGFRADVESLERVSKHSNGHTIVKGLEIVHHPEHAQTHIHPVVVDHSGPQNARQARQVVR